MVKATRWLQGDTHALAPVSCASALAWRFLTAVNSRTVAPKAKDASLSNATFAGSTDTSAMAHRSAPSHAQPDSPSLLRARADGRHAETQAVRRAPRRHARAPHTNRHASMKP